MIFNNQKWNPKSYLTTKIIEQNKKLTSNVCGENQKQNPKSYLTTKIIKQNKKLTSNIYRENQKRNPKSYLTTKIIEQNKKNLPVTFVERIWSKKKKVLRMKPKLCKGFGWVESNIRNLKTEY